MSRSDDDHVVVSLEITDALRLLERLKWQVDDLEARDPFRTNRRYRVTSTYQLAMAIERAVRDLRGELPEVPK